jgi:hypothetical protein
MAKPKSLTIKTYNVGFGDCFLLTFKYASRSRHILIDFGSQRRPVNPKPNHMVKVAQQIAKDCNNKLDVIVATHRHQDHISGFATNKKKNAPGDIIARLKPEIVVQPWTEHPRAPRDAKVAPTRALRQAHVRKLNKLHAVAETIPAQLKGLRGIDRATRARLEFLGQNNIKNRSAVTNLLKMARPHKGRYVHCGSASGFGRLLPGVKIHVLGPPTLVQTETIKDQVHDHPEEFWHLQSAAASADDKPGSPLFPDAPTGRSPASARWFTARLNQIRAEELLQIVRILDDAMNNTSVILLFECGTKSFLFSGDAQWENWAYALSNEKYRKLLRKVDLYKVGHHGSLNATPKSLWKLFRQRGRAQKKNRLQTVLSTKHGVHGSESRDSEVPRRTLVDELKKKSHLTTTEEFGSDLFRSTTFRF